MLPLAENPSRVCGRHSEPIAGATLVDLPFHHRDPFDRMLIVQARHEGLTFVTADWELEPYDAAILWA